jgi:hypothetical protein
VTPSTMLASLVGREIGRLLAHRDCGPALTVAEDLYRFSCTSKDRLIVEAVAVART